MTVPSIIDRYVFREIVVSFLFCFSVFLVAGLIAGFLPLLQKGMEAGLEITLILFQVLINALPSTLVTVLPLSIMIGILLGLGRMAADSEIAAIKSSGISVVRLLPAVLALAMIGLAMSLICTLILIPRGIAEGRRLMQGALTTRVDAGIEERHFFDTLKNMILYVEKIDSSTGIMSRIFIRESSNPDEVNTIIAREGKTFPDPEGKAFVLHLRNGTIIKEDKYGDTTGTLSFDSYVFRYPLDKAASGDAPKPLEEMTIAGIRDRVRSAVVEKDTDTPEVRAYQRRVRTHARVLITQRFTYPFACLALALMAFPLGLLNLGKSRLNNVSVGLVVMFLYYAFTLATERAARSGLAPPELALPVPAVVFMCVSAYFIRCVRLERIPGLIRYGQHLILKLRRQEA